MPRVLHRVSPNRERELRERAFVLAEQRLAGRVICAQCRATIKNFADACAAGTNVNCPGDDALGRAYASACRDLGVEP